MVATSRARSSRHCRRRVLLLAGLLGLSAGLLSAPAQRAEATSITVNTALDPAPDGNGYWPVDGTCSLRAAVESAATNSNLHDPDCAVGLAGQLDSIHIDGSLTGQTLTMLPLPFAAIMGPDNPMEIIGPTTGSGGFTIDGNNATRIFELGYVSSPSSGARLRLANLTVKRGSGQGHGLPGDGGAILMFDASELTLDNVVMRDNRVTGSARGAAIYAVASTITNNGGAYINNNADGDAATSHGRGGAVFMEEGPSTLNGYAVLFESNRAAYAGGAVATNPGASSALFHLERSLVKDNSATVGGVMFIDSTRAGKVLELHDSTMTGNSATQGGGVFFSQATTQSYEFLRDTFVNNTGGTPGGGLFSAGGGFTANSIIVDSGCKNTTSIENHTGAQNLFGGTNTGCNTTYMGSVGTISGLAASLAQNGGPEVQRTYALLAGSNAIDNGAAAYCGTVDARSIPRGVDGNGVPNNPQTGDCDVGAYEYASYIVNFETGTSSVAEGGSSAAWVKLKIADPALSPLTAPLTVNSTLDPSSTARMYLDYNIPGYSVTFPAGSGDGSRAFLTLSSLTDGIAEAGGEFVAFNLGGSATPGVVIAEPRQHTMTIQDADQAGIITDDGGNGTTVSEADTAITDSLTVRLRSRPDYDSQNVPADVMMRVEPDRDCEVGVGAGTARLGSPVSIAIPNADWQTGRSLTARALQDFYDEDVRDETVRHPCRITFTFSSADPVYNATTAAYNVDVIDNDEAGVTITALSAANLVEGGAAATYTVVLNTPPDPGDPVPYLHATAVVADPGTECALDLDPGDAIDPVPGAPVSLPFAASDWNVPRTVTVTADDDVTVELDHPCSIVHTITGDDPVYGNLDDLPLFAFSPATVTAAISDYQPPTITNDPPNVIVSTAAGGPGVHVDEATPSVSDTFSVVLERRPLADVAVNLAASSDPLIPDTQLLVQDDNPVTTTEPGPSLALTFTPGNWNTPQIVNVFAADDDYDEASTGALVTATIDSTAAGFNDPALRTVTLDGTVHPNTAEIAVTAADDDTSSIVLGPDAASVALAEGGVDDSYTLTLGSHPYADVEVTIDPDGECGVNNGTYGGIDVVTVAASAWDVPVTVAVDAANDALVEPAHQCTITHSAHSSGDALYDIPAGAPLAPPVVASIADNDPPRVLISTSGGVSADEASPGATGTYSVRLASQPDADVTVTATADGQVTVRSGSAPAGPSTSLTFTTTDWLFDQTVTVAAADDPVDEDTPHTATITHAVTSTATGFATAPEFWVDGTAGSTVGVSVADNDTAAVTVAESGGSTAVTEGGSGDTYTVVLATQPVAGVTVSVSPGPDCTAIPVSVAFTTDSWNAPQTVTLSAVDDTRLEGAHSCAVTHSATSTDPKYDGIAAPGVSAAVTDNDHPDVVLSGAAGLLFVSEATPGTADSFTAVLQSEPQSDVTVTFTGSATIPQVLLDDPATPAAPAAAVSVTFTPADWAAPKAVEVFAVDDADIEASPHHTPVTATMTSTALGYSDPAQRRFVLDGGDSSPNTVSFAASITDNDVAGIATSTTAVSVTEGGAGAAYFFSLTSRPSSPVTVTVDPGDECAVNGGAAGAPADVVLTRDGWNVAATITVTAVDDPTAEATESCPITHTAASADAHYQGLAGPTVTAEVTDNDPAGVTISTGGGVHVSEADPADPGSYTVVLTAAPDADVTVHMTVTDGQTAVAGNGGAPGAALDLVFTPANWNTPQAADVSAVDDDYDEADPHTGTIGHAVSSSATGYRDGVGITVDGLLGSDVAVSIADDDTAGFILTEKTEGTAVAEGGASDTYTVVLNSAPAAEVTVTVLGGADCTALPGTLVFDAGNWSSPQTVTVTAVDDPTAEGTEVCGIKHFVTSSDPNYDNIMAELAVTVTDNETAGVTITTLDAALAEADSADTGAYTIVLDAQPTGDVTVVASVSDGQTTLGGSGAASLDVVFTPANWATPQTATVHAVDDDVRDAESDAVVHHSVTSTAFGYSSGPAIQVDGLAGSDVHLTVADDDAPVAVDDAYSTNEDTMLTVPADTGLLANDEGGVTVAVVDNTDHGILALNADGSFTYAPAVNFNGIDAFTYEASDGRLPSNLATVTITVTAVDDPPAAAADSYATDEDTPLTVPATGVLGNDADVEGDPLTAELVADPAHGTLALAADGSFTYTPAADYHGPDSFTYRASAGGLASDGVTVAITVNPVNDPPDMPADLGQYASGGTTAIPVGGVTTNQTVVFKGTVTDRDGDDVRLVIEAKPIGTPWDGSNLVASDQVSSGSVAGVSATMPWGAYHWQAWAKDSDGAVSQAVSWGSNPDPGDSDFEVHATTTLLYNGDQLVYLRSPLTAAAKLSSPAGACVDGQSISFETDDDPRTAALEDGHYALGADATANSDGQASVSGIDTTGWQPGVYTVRAMFAGTDSCEPSSDEATLTIADPGDSATGGGWYTLPGGSGTGSGRVNFGFTVHRVPGTDPPQYKGQALLINNGKWRLKGNLDRYAQIGASGSATGTARLYGWDATLNDGLGGWVLTATDVPFTISFADHGTGGKKAAADTFGIHIDYATDSPSPPLPNSAPQALKGGNIRIGPLEAGPPEGGKPGGGKKK